MIVCSTSPQSDLESSSSLGGYSSLAGCGDSCSSLSDEEVLPVLLGAFANPEVEIFATNVPALLLGHSNDLLGTSYLCRVSPPCCNLPLASCNHSSSGSGSLEHNLSSASQHLTALDSCSSCLSCCNDGSSMSSASLGHQASICSSLCDLLSSDHHSSAACCQSPSSGCDSSGSLSSSCSSTCEQNSSASPCSQNSLLSECSHASSFDSTGPSECNSSGASLSLSDKCLTTSNSFSDNRQSPSSHCFSTLFQQSCLCSGTWAASEKPAPKTLSLGTRLSNSTGTSFSLGVDISLGFSL